MTESDRIPFFPNFLKVVSSTNALAREYINKNAPEWTVISSGFQNAGRGQQGNRWESTADKNLLASWILYPHFLEPSEQFSLSIINSLAIIDLLNDYQLLGKIKWPNDIYIGHQKLAGMLIENSIEGSVLSNSIIGTGLNVNQIRFSEELLNPISLKLLTGKAYSIEELLFKLHTCLYRRYETLKNHGLGRLMEEYIDNVYLLNTRQQYKDDKGLFYARIVTVEYSGLLVMEDDDRNIRKYAFKEVSFPVLG